MNPGQPAFLKPNAMDRVFNRLFGLLVGLGIGLPHNYVRIVRINGVIAIMPSYQTLPFPRSPRGNHHRTPYIATVC